ncbi:MAG: prephenate dehydrogenase [Gemmatimonadota bacterium]
MKLPNVTVVGLGCIGGSLLKALASNGAHVLGFSASADDRALAREHGYEVPDANLVSAMEEADVIVIAVPLQAIAEVATTAIRGAPSDATIFHCGGVQSRMALRLDEARYARVLGTHPLAGSHESGFRAARADLFEGCTVSIESRQSEQQRRWAKWLWERVGAARLEYRAAEEHDAMMAWISHLPQLASTALAATFAAEHIDPCSVGPGARDTTRLAASGFEQWSSLVQAQPALLDDALSKLQHTVASLRDALAQGDQRALREIWESARAWRRAAEPPA